MQHLLRSLALAALVLTGAPALAQQCLEVTLTGTQGGPPVFMGQAGSGTLVRYGTTENGCSDVLLQFDAGRGTTQQLSKAGVPVGRLNAVFFTHIHSDHSEGFIDMAQLRWHFNSEEPKLDVICSVDAISGAGHTLSCEKFASSVGDTLIASGEMAQRLVENPKRLPGGPADLLNALTFTPSDTPQQVWQKEDVTVSAIRSTHVPGHASYRVDTPAGSVVIGGDAGNDARKPPRTNSTSEQVETLSTGADILVHSVIHPVMGPDGSSGFPPPVFFRQSTATDLGAMSERASVGHLMLTHLIPPIGAPRQGPFPVEGGGLSEADYIDAVRSGGFGGDVTVGTDMATHRIVAK